jgi:hypothetical protein
MLLYDAKGDSLLQHLTAGVTALRTAATAADPAIATSAAAAEVTAGSGSYYVSGTYV